MKRHLIAALKQSLIESDFKSARKKFLDQGINSDTIIKYIDDFKDLKKKNRIKEPVKKDIDNWARKEFKEFKIFVDKLKKTKSKTQEEKLQKKEGAKLITENEFWYVYKILTHEASCYYGAGTQWCTTTKDSDKWWLRNKGGNDIFYFISKTLKPANKWYKIAFLVDGLGDIETYDSTDDSESNMPAKIKKTLPKIDFKPADVAVFIDGKKYTASDVEKGNIPKNIKGNLTVSRSTISRIPSGLRIGGKLILVYTNITKIPKNTKIGGSLHIDGSSITTIPFKNINGDLMAGVSQIIELPEDLHVTGRIWLYGTPIKSLPSGLRVDGDLNITKTKIKELPDDIQIGGKLMLGGKKMKNIPDDVTVE